MDGEQDGVRVGNNAAACRFEAEVDGQVAVAEYRRDGAAVVFTHTSVPEALRGRGVGGRLARAALEAARAEGLAVVPLCPFFAGYIRRHPEYAALVPLRYQRLVGAAGASTTPEYRS